MTAFVQRFNRFFRPATLALAGAFALGNLGATGHAQTLPAAGTPISNQATATYQFGDVTVNLLSNRVQVTVAPVEALRLTSDNERLAPIGAPVAVPHRLTNTGNVAASYIFSVQNQTGDDYDLRDPRVYGDLNGNGLVDDGEPRLDNQATPILLQPGQSTDVLVTGFVATTATPGQSARVLLGARTQSNGASAQNTDTIRVVAGVAVDVRKEASSKNGTRGQNVDYDLIATSRGTAAPDPIAATVDGARRDLVLLRDTVPANTSFVSWTTASNNPLLYHRIGDAENTYTSAPSGVTDAIAMGLLNFGPGTTARATLRVRINDNASGSFDNTAQIIYNQTGVDTRVVAPSNTVGVAVAHRAADADLFHRRQLYPRGDGDGPESPAVFAGR